MVWSFCYHSCVTCFKKRQEVGLVCLSVLSNQRPCGSAKILNKIRTLSTDSAIIRRELISRLLADMIPLYSRTLI